MTDTAVATGEDHVPEWTFGDRLRKAREFAGLDQSAMAKRLGVTDGSISNWEKGRSLPRGGELRLAQRWAEETGVPIGWLVGVDLRSRCLYVIGHTGQTELALEWSPRPALVAV